MTKIRVRFFILYSFLSFLFFCLFLIDLKLNLSLLFLLLKIKDPFFNTKILSDEDLMQWNAKLIPGEAFYIQASGTRKQNKNNLNSNPENNHVEISYKIDHIKQQNDWLFIGKKKRDPNMNRSLKTFQSLSFLSMLKKVIVTGSALAGIIVVIMISICWIA